MKFRWEDSFVLLKSIKLFALVVLVFVSLVLLIPFMVILLLLTLHILSRPSLIELLSMSIEFRSGFLFMLSIEEVVDEGFKKFVDKQEELLGVPWMLTEWKACVYIEEDLCLLTGSNIF
jgi:hypothetical protein